LASLPVLAVPLNQLFLVLISLPKQPALFSALAVPQAEALPLPPLLRPRPRPQHVVRSPQRVRKPPRALVDDLDEFGGVLLQRGRGDGAGVGGGL
jgi:hypothetical protein